MRKTLIEPDGKLQQKAAEWLDLDQLAHVEITSEDPLFPIEQALKPAPSTGWRAAVPGPQTIRLHFDQPLELHTIRIHIIERAAERMQELSLFVKTAGIDRQEVVRQQFTFSPGGSTEEIEEFAVVLKQVEMVELRIDPDRAHNPSDSRSYATLASLSLA